MQKLTISIIQADLVWENVDANLNAFANKIQSIESTDLIVLPETFSTSFSMNSEALAEPMNGKAMSWMAEMAQNKNAVIASSAILKEKNKIFNRFIWMRPDGTFEKYDKRHLFRMGDEHNHFTPGRKRLIVKLKGWKICPQICYDLRFPVWSRNKKQEYDLLLYVANWPEVRTAAWEKLLYARAIENQCYVAAVNRIGIDGEGVNCNGNSMLIDPKGELIWKAPNQKESTKTVNLNFDELNSFREKFRVGMDADDFEVR
ncbi:amidohydrolase [Vicingaceae bacterium]|nr:amidohydrolase [Vicingaceae bacterium]MDB4060938.1 amidohydrolase [Vicingaceae bacterium]MDB9963777.1 amidohydrolase [Vicingaceae bacterium]MDC0004982.1 amidohydrolase [bacterium]MDC1450879.1 amidohydrolase [Vicingaceae bacterium]